MAKGFLYVVGNSRLYISCQNKPFVKSIHCYHSSLCLPLNVRSQYIVGFYYFFSERPATCIVSYSFHVMF